MATYLLMQIYATSSDSLNIVFVESDMIVSQKFTDVMPDLVASTAHDGIFTIYNSLMHPGQRIEGNWVYKSIIPFAGTVISRTIIKDVMEKVNFREPYHVELSNYLRRVGKRLASTRVSFLQHLILHEDRHNDQRLRSIGREFVGVTSAENELMIEQLYMYIRKLEQKIFELQSELKVMENTIGNVIKRTDEFYRG